MSTPKGKVITLADGKKYTLAPMNLNTLTNLEDEFDCDIEEVQVKMVTGRKASVFRRLLWVFLKEDHPDLTLKDVGCLVVLDQMADIVADITAALDSLKEE